MWSAAATLRPVTGRTIKDTGAGGARVSRETVLRTVAASLVLVVAIDLWLPSSAVVGALHILPVFASAWLGSRRFAGVVAGAAAVLATAGAFVALGGGAPAPALTVGVQLGVALFVILVAHQLAGLRIASEERLARSREVVVTALASIADAVLTTDRDDEIALINARAEGLLGWDHAAALGRPVRDVLRLEDDRETSPPSDPRAPRRQLLVARDGSRRPVEVTASPIFAASGAPQGRVWVLRDAKDLAAYEARLRDLAFRDGLTGLSNRRALEERLDLELARARRSHTRLGLLFIDLDRFKSVNDTFGHRVGDLLLVAVAERLLGTLRQADTIARISGDEFCVLVPDVTNVATAEQVALKVLEALVRPVVLEGAVIPIASSIGVAVYPDHASGAEELMRVADLAMYRAKGLGGAGLALHEGPARRFTPKYHTTGTSADDGVPALASGETPARVNEDAGARARPGDEERSR